MHAPPPYGPPPSGDGAPATEARGRGRVWLVAGTGEGPPLARCLLERGWHLRVSVVTPAARLGYPEDPQLEVAVGALAGAEAWRAALAEAERRGDPFHWLIDASHPFATQVTAALVAACAGRPERLLRLRRPALAAARAIPLDHFQDLGAHLAQGERLLLAIGARHLATAVAQSPGAHHHCRVLPHPQALRQALRAGLAPERIAGLHPTADGGVERALCRHWRIDTILCRQSGSPTEALWLRISEELGLRLLLLRRPREPEGGLGLPLAELIEHVGWPMGAGNGRSEASHGGGEGRDGG